jgi:hypothetical protein
MSRNNWKIEFGELAAGYSMSIRSVEAVERYDALDELRCMQ